MECRDVQDRLEAVAAGDEPATPDVRAHVEGCLRCAAALAAARRIDLALAARPAPPAPARFTGAVTGRLRRERWRSEQNVDRLFNAAVVFGLLIVAGGVAALLNLGDLLGALTRGLSLISQFGGEAVSLAVPVVPTYVAAGVFLLTALAVWWWAERRLSL